MIELLNRYRAACVDCPSVDNAKLLPNAVPIEGFMVARMTEQRPHSMTIDGANANVDEVVKKLKAIAAG